MLTEAANHLWQSTVFALAVALASVAFRRNRARVRYWLWLGASLKFLVPFALLISLGSALAPTRSAAPAIGPLPAVSQTIVEPFSPATAARPAVPVHNGGSWTRTALAGAWACGFAAVVLMRFRASRRIRTAMRNSAHLCVVPGGIQARRWADRLEPGVVGIFRPVLLLPADIEQYLDPAQLRAVLEHEACHVRMRDNLTSALHMITEALFWFHPLVWWIGARLMEERERACDEAVLARGSAPRDYAEAILNVCKSYVGLRPSLVSGVGGADLKKRIQAILSGHGAQEVTPLKKIALAAAMVAAVGVPLGIGLATPHVRAQAESSGIGGARFESASVKPCATYKPVTAAFPSGMGTTLTGCTTLERYIQQAYGLFAEGHTNQLSLISVQGGPAWVDSQLFEIEAKAAAPQSRAMLNGPMLEQVLRDAFKLRVHRQTSTVPVYTLTKASARPDLQPFTGSCTTRDPDAGPHEPSPGDCARPRFTSSGLDLHAAGMPALCAFFQLMLERPVIDDTGLTGRFNLHLDVPADVFQRPRMLPALRPPSASAETDPATVSAVVDAAAKIGLKLRKTEGPGEVIIIDHVEKPSGS